MYRFPADDPGRGMGVGPKLIHYNMKYLGTAMVISQKIMRNLPLSTLKKGISGTQKQIGE